MTVAAVSVDFAGVPVIKRFKEAKKFSFEVYADPDFSVPIAFGLTMTPSSVVIDKEGKVLAIYGGYDAGVKAKLADLFK